MRTIPASKDFQQLVKQSPTKTVNIYGFWPIDKADCVCQKFILQMKKRLGESLEKDRRRIMEQMKFLECPRDKSLLKRYVVKCSKCNEIQGYCWAKDKTLTDWCDFHYSQWTDGKEWHGCFTPHISPITELLHFECCCGNDTRDFRANMTLNQNTAEHIEARNARGRRMGLKGSKFYVEKFTNNQLR